METTQTGIFPEEARSPAQGAVQLSLFTGRRAAQDSTTVKDIGFACRPAPKIGREHQLHQLKGVPIDRDMQVAFQLAKTLKGRGSHRRTYAKLSADQKHQFGNAICEHLLASLRQQVAREQR